MTQENYERLKYYTILATILNMLFIFLVVATAHAYTDDQIADAIYKAEGGSKTAHPYGILGHWHQSPRQICLNTIAHARRDWNGQGDFIAFLGSRYAPTKNCTNDPKNLNKNWVRNVKFFLKKGD